MSLPPSTGAVELESFIQHTVRLFSQRKRVDGRSFDAIRAPHVLRDRQDGALASVLYTDDTGSCVSCNVTGVFAPPHPSRPDEGRLTVDVTAPFLSGPAGGSATGEALGEVAHFVRAALEACADLASLCVLPGEACWLLRAEIAVLSADGGLRAAALHGAVAALRGLSLPAARLPTGAVAAARRLSLRAAPVAVSFALVAAAAEVWALADPTAAEEAAADGIATIAVDEAGGIVAVAHSGRCPLAPQRLTRVVEMMDTHAQTIRKAIFESKDEDQNNG